MIVNFNDLELKMRYKIMSRSVIPRPIAWIVTEGKALNIAPFSYFIPLSSNPATLIVSIGHKKDGSPKDTLKNILESKKCTICSVAPDQITQMDKSSEALDEEISEAKLFNIPTKRVLQDFPPIIKGSPTAFFCSLYKKIDLDGSKTIPLILEIEHYFVEDQLTDKKFNIQFQTVARVGSEYRLCETVIKPNS